MKISIKGKEADQQQINVETVVEIFSGYNKFVKEFGRSQDIHDLELVITDIEKGSVTFNIETIIKEPLFAEERRENFLNSMNEFHNDFKSQNKEKLKKYTPKVLSLYANNYLKLNDLIENNYKIDFHLKDKIDVTIIHKDILNQYKEIKEEKEKTITTGYISGAFSLSKKDKLQKIEKIEYIYDDKNDNIIFYFIFFKDRKFHFKQPLSIKIFKNDDELYEMRLPKIEYFVTGETVQETIDNFKELMEVIFDEYGKEESNKLTEKALIIKKIVNNIIEEEI